MKKILYIYGIGSSPKSNTFQMLKEVMSVEPYCYEVVCFEYNQNDPKIGIAELEKIVAEQKPVAIIASSLGAFYALNMSVTIPVMVINPCLRPTLELPKLGFDGEPYREIEERMFKEFHESPVNQLEDIFGFFGTSDEMFSYAKEFNKLYPARTFIGGHHPTKENLKAMRPEIHKQIVFPLHARKI